MVIFVILRWISFESLLMKWIGDELRGENEAINKVDKDKDVQTLSLKHYSLKCDQH